MKQIKGGWFTNVWNLNNGYVVLATSDKLKAGFKQGEYIIPEMQSGIFPTFHYLGGFDNKEYREFDIFVTRWLPKATGTRQLTNMFNNYFSKLLVEGSRESDYDIEVKFPSKMKDNISKILYNMDVEAIEQDFTNLLDYYASYFYELHELSADFGKQNWMNFADGRIVAYDPFVHMVSANLRWFSAKKYPTTQELIQFLNADDVKGELDEIYAGVNR